MASKRSIATPSAVRTSFVSNSGISFTGLAFDKRFGTGGDVVDAGRSRTLHHRSADGYGR
jgi:hypothetical protein